MKKHNDSMYEADTALARIDAIATATLSGKLLARYEAYKQILVARDQDHATIAATLTLFVADLSKANARSAVIRSGNGS